MRVAGAGFVVAAETAGPPLIAGLADVAAGVTAGAVEAIGDEG
jgi:hypothetical protein